jgi:hypothetical protein
MNNFPRPSLRSCSGTVNPTICNLVGMLVLALIGNAQTFTPTGSLNTGRNGHRAITLNNGTVLIVGGYDSSQNALASAEIYDPATGVFTATDRMNVARRNFGITLLDDGSVLVTGGYDASFNSLASAETYDPATGVFTPTGSLMTARGDLTATRLTDGTVLIAGGFDTNGNALSSAERYVPSTGTFVPTGSLKGARGFATATALMDGTVLVEGGWAVNSALSSSEIYDPTTSTFTGTGTLNFARVRNTATLLNSGKVLVVGGEDSTSNILASAELYDPVLGVFAPTGGLNVARGDHAATLLTNGMVLVEGGFACDPLNCAATDVDMSPSAEIYDPVPGSFSVTGSLATARQAHTATLLSDGSVLVAGGWNPRNWGLTTAELYKPATLTPQNLVSIGISPVNPSLIIGTSQALVAVGTFSDSSTQTLASVIWSSSNSVVATTTRDSGSNSGIGNDSANSGLVFGISPGTATISACAGSICGSTMVTVGSPSGSPGFSLNGSPGSLTVNHGDTATFSVVLTAQNGFSQPVTFLCGQLPPAARCTITPSSLAPRPSSPATGKVTITTAGASLTALSGSSIPGESLWGWMGANLRFVRMTVAAAVLPLGLGLCLLAPRRRRTAARGLVTILLLAHLVACGGGSGVPMGSETTPPGSYIITVTASSNEVSSSIQLSLVVK